MSYTKLQIQEFQQQAKQVPPTKKNPTPRHITAKFRKNERQRQERRKHLTYKGANGRVTSQFSSETIQERGKQSEYLKC